MTPVKGGKLLTLSLCLLLLSALAEPPAAEEASGARNNVEAVLTRLEEKASLVQTLKADFVEEKSLAVLDRPLVLKGTLFLQKPSLFAWHVTEPLRYSMVIRGESMRQWDEDSDRVQEMPLSKNPTFKMAIRQMRDWFSGAYKPMLREYEVVALDEDPISLRFVPRQDGLAQGVIDSVTVVFDEDERYVRWVRVVERGGDSTLLTFSDATLNVPIDPSAWKLEQRVR